MKFCSIIILFSFSFGQSLDQLDLNLKKLNSVLETASRSSQKVFVDDFTGLLWPYCPSASFAISEMLELYPETLIPVEWHSSGFTPGGSDFDIPAYSTRAALYNVGGIPHTQWNGTESTVGGFPNGNWQAFIGDFTNIYNGMVGNDTPYEIEINGYAGNTVNYDVTVSMDSDMSNSNQKVDIFLVEDNIWSYWSGASS